MNSFRRFSPFIFTLIGLIFLCPSAHAETLQDMIGKLEVLPLHYGVNEIKVNNRDIIIVRGAVVTGTAGGHDTYIVLAKQENPLVGKKPFWQFARFEGDKQGILIETAPHTYEDSIVSIRFMVPKEGKDLKNVSDLYLFTAARKFVVPLPTPSQPDFSLSVLNRQNDEMGTLFFHTLKKMSLKEKYCNADWPAYKILGVPLPGEEGTYSCRIRK